MATRPDKRLVVLAGQSVLRLDDPSVVVDGVWGAKTQDSFDRATDRSKTSVMQLAESKGYSIQELAGRPAVNVDREGMRVLVTRIAEEEGVPAQTALKIVKLESGFDPNAKSPTGYVGLFQLGTPAMTDVYRSKPAGVDWVPAGHNKSGPLFRMAKPFDPEQNSRVGCRYIRIVADRYMRVSLSDVVPLYMAFNIGSQGAKHVLAGRPELAAKEIAANPAYGKGNPRQYMAALTQAVQAA